MRYPPRLAHLATRAVVTQKLAPTYAQSHQVDEDEAQIRISRALAGPLLDELLAAAWSSLLAGTKRLDENGLLEKIAGSLKDRPMRPGKVNEVTTGWSAFLVRVDLDAGLASDAARKVLESPEGQKRLNAGIEEVGAALAKELTRK